MLIGIKSNFLPDPEIAEILSQWIGCARVIYNAKCDEDKYLRSFARKYLPTGTLPKIDQKYSQYKTELTPWLKKCPSQILRNSAVRFFDAYQNFFNGTAGRPVRKTRSRGNSIWLTKEVFRIRWNKNRAIIELGTSSNPVGTIAVNFTKKRIPNNNPSSIVIRKTNVKWSVSFNYENGEKEPFLDPEDTLDYLRSFDREELAGMITGVDRGVARPVQTDKACFKLSDKALAKMQYRDKLVKRFQRKAARQLKGSNQRRRTICRIAKLKNTDKCVREDFWHKTTRAVVDSSRVVVMEDLKLKNMVKAPKPKVCEQTGKWLRNGARSKAGLNRVLHSVGLYQFEQFMTYKMKKAGKPLYKVSAHHTSQECAVCGHTHPDNRKTQADFECQACGHRDNADHNAALVIRNRAVNLILDSGTELVGANRSLLQSRAIAKASKTTSS